MKTFLKSSASLLVLASFSVPALGADVYNGGSTKDAPANFDAPRINFTGFYVGGAIGYGNANHDLSVQDYFKDYCGDVGEEAQFGFEDGSSDIGNRADYLADGTLTCATPEAKNGYDSIPVSGDSRDIATLDGLNTTGIVGDVRVGYDQQVGRFVGGIFGSYGFSSMDADGSISIPGLGGSFDLERGDDWSIGVRAGMLVNERTLLYILAAYTQTEYELSFTDGKDVFSKKTTFDGVTIGGGVEFALTQNVFLGVEGTHTFYGEEALFDDYDPKKNEGTRLVDDLGETKVMGTLKIKLNSGLGF